MDLVCRLCAKEKTEKQLGHNINDRTLNIQQKLIDCCRWTSIVPIEYETLPKRVCNPCYRKLESCWSFAESVAQAQEELLSVVGEEKPGIAPIEHVNITIVKDEPFESANVIDSIDTNATVEPREKLEVVLKQDELDISDHNIDYDDDNDDDYVDDLASLSSIEHDIFGTTSTTTATTTSIEKTTPATAGSSKSQSNTPNKSKAAKKKSAAKDIDVESNRKKLQKLPRSQSCICDTCGKELLHADGLKRHLKIHSNELNYACKTCGKRFLRRDNLREHENIHAGIKPYACHLCEYRCGNSGNICKHLKQKHGVIRKTEIVWR